MPGSPADKEHIADGDVIESIGDQSTRELSLAVIRLMLDGKPGTTCHRRRGPSPQARSRQGHPDPHHRRRPCPGRAAVRKRLHPLPQARRGHPRPAWTRSPPRSRRRQEPQGCCSTCATPPAAIPGRGPPPGQLLHQPGHARPRSRARSFPSRPSPPIPPSASPPLPWRYWSIAAPTAQPS